ncbi:MAG: 2-oxo acid dehydrogenase subunit E2 [Anaerolineaceae bacterium]|nr:2-oxo acid dehydrogenase subunit E2 [Anaerolineaceae bacterium]
MAAELFVPKLGQTVEEVTLMNWLVEDGARVEFGTPVLEVETDKAVFPVEANANGYLHIGPYLAGQVVPVLTVVATIGKRDEPFAIQSPATAGESTPAPAAVPEKPPAPEMEAGSTGEEPARLFSSPRARKLAHEKQVDLSHVTPTGGQGVRVIEKDVLAYLSQAPRATPVAANMAAQFGLPLDSLAGSGPKGAITKADIQRALEEKTPPAGAPAVEPAMVPPGDEVSKVLPLSGVRGIIFERMGTSVHTTARVTLTTEVDATDLVTVRQRLKESASQAWGFTPGYNDLIGVITARALQEFPYMNARLRADGQAVEWLAHVNLGMAVDTERGLLVPVIGDADRKGLRAFGSEFRQLVERARAGRALPDDLRGGSFTITNLGMYDIDAFTPVINLPEVAILGVGRIEGKVVPYQEQITVRQRLTLSLVFDHRLNDGAPAARFLQRIKQYVENPFLLLG